MKLLFLSEDENIGREVCDEAAKQNWSALLVRDKGDLNKAMNGFNPDMMIVDVDGPEDLQWFEEHLFAQQKPVFFLNRELTEEFAVRAFEAGADGLLPRALFSRRFLVARVNAYLTRQGLLGGRRMVPRLKMTFDNQRQRVEIDGSRLMLTLTEFKILSHLATDVAKVVDRRELQREVFGENEVSKRSLDVHVCALRKKLKPFQLDISSSRGVGYRLGTL